MSHNSRRYSCASDDSVVSSTSSLSDVWTGREQEDANRATMWSQHSHSDEVSLLNVSKDNGQQFPDYYSLVHKKRGTDSHFEQEHICSGFSSDSEICDFSGYTRLLGYGYNPEKNKFSQMAQDDSRRDSMYSDYSDQRPSGFSTYLDRRNSNSSNSNRFSSDQEKKKKISQIGEDDCRRDSIYSGYSDRRSSGFSSDFNRRDSISNTSNSEQFSSNSGYIKSTSSSIIPECQNENMFGLKEVEEKFSTISTFKMAHPGMDYVPEWLKSLRLHKYTNMIMSLTYEQMLELNEDKLEKLNVKLGKKSGTN